MLVEPGLNGRPVARRDLTYSDLVDVFLERHAIVAKPRTITELRWRLKQSEAKFGAVPLVELEGMADEIAGFAVTISDRMRHPLMAALASRGKRRSCANRADWCGIRRRLE